MRENHVRLTQAPLPHLRRNNPSNTSLQLSTWTIFSSLTLREMWFGSSKHDMHCKQSRRHHMVVQNEDGNQKGSICHQADSFHWKSWCLKFGHQYPEIEGTAGPIEMQHSS